MLRLKTRDTKIEAELAKADPILGRLIKAVVAKSGQKRISSPKFTPFEALARAIVYQSVSTKAAAVIHKRLQDSVKGAFTPNKTLAVPQSKLRKLGLSKSKAKSVHHLAAWFNDNHKLAKNLAGMPDEEVIKALTTIHGIGVWTVNMFLMFNLRRPDIMPANDLGIRQGVQLLYGMETVATPKQVQERALRWQPYCSIASIYLWNAVNLKITAEDF